MRAMHETLGAVAAVLTTSAFLPQAARTLRTGDTKSLSLVTWVLFEAGVLCWLVYGAWIDSASVFWANAVTSVLAGAVLAVKVRNVWSGVDRALPHTVETDQ